MNTISWELLCTCIMYIYRTHGLDRQLSVFVMATGDAKLSGLFTWSSNSVMLYTCIRCGYNISEISRYVQQYCHRENKTLVAKFNGLFVIKTMLSVYCSGHSLSESSLKTITTTCTQYGCSQAEQIVVMRVLLWHWRLHVCVQNGHLLLIRRFIPETE